MSYSQHASGRHLHTAVDTETLLPALGGTPPLEGTCEQCGGVRLFH